MNIENMLKVKEAVINSPNFDMSQYFYTEYEKGVRTVSRDGLKGNEVISIRETNPCGTAACIAGEATILYIKEFKESKDELFGSYSFFECASKFMGLSNDQANWLFLGRWFRHGELDDITKREAACAIQYLIDHDGVCSDKYGENIVLF